MAKINDSFLQSIVYLYPSENEALRNSAVGGTGFLFGVRDKDTDQIYRVFIITCKHLLQTENIYFRVNTKDGLYKIITTKHNQWHIDSSEDLAIYPLPFDEDLKISFIKNEIDTISEEIIERLNIGPGDGSYIIGEIYAF